MGEESDELGHLARVQASLMCTRPALNVVSVDLGRGETRQGEGAHDIGVQIFSGCQGSYLSVESYSRSAVSIGEVIGVEWSAA